MSQMNSSQSITIRDVAKLAGVSISTASRALTGAGGVSPALEGRILAVARKLNYRPNAAARGLRKSRTATLGIVFNNLRGPGQLDLLKGIGTCCNVAGFGLLAADADGDHDLYRTLVARFFEQRVEGLFLVSPIDLGDSLLDYRRASVPVIALFGKDSSAGSTPVVAASEKRGIHDAIAGLFDFGHREIAYFLRFWDDRRLREVLDALVSVGLTASESSTAFEGAVRDEEVHDAVHRALSSSDRPSALVVHSTFLGATLAAIHELDLAVPRDVSLVSVGASSWHQLLVPGLAAVEADAQALGRLGCRVMMDWIGGKEPLPAYSELAKWAPRGSVGPAPVATTHGNSSPSNSSAKASL